MGTSTHRKTCRRYDNPGQAHFLTFSCLQRRPFLSRDRCCQWLATAIQRGRQRGQFDLWAYVFMPEHVHVVLLPTPDTGISKILESVKGSVSKKAIHWLKRNDSPFLDQLRAIDDRGEPHYHFWLPGGGYDRNLRDLDETYEKIDYCHANPVRRGLVENPEDWVWSSWRAWQEGIDEPIGLDRDSLPPRIH